jgi:hypothetical protein
MHLLIATALIATPVAQQDGLCGEVAKLVAGAKEAQPFETMFAAKDQPRLLPAGGCFRAAERHWLCHQNLLPRDIAHDTLGQRIAACLPGEITQSGASWRGIRTTMVKGNGLVFELEETGSERAHVGRIMQIDIRAER